MWGVYRVSIPVRYTVFNISILTFYTARMLAHKRLQRELVALQKEPAKFIRVSVLKEVEWS
jgi:hypothetical protein